MSEITLKIKSLQQKEYTVQVPSNITIGDLKKHCTETLDAGFATTCVFKGVPLKDDSKTIDSLNIGNGDVVICIFKKTAPAAAPAAVPPVPAPVADTSAPAPTEVGMMTPPPTRKTEPAPAPAVAATPIQAPMAKVFYDDWACPMCTYINIGARSVCEMCETRNPVRPEVQRVHYDDDEVDMDNLGGSPFGDMSDGVEVDIEELLTRAENDETLRGELNRSVGLPDDATIDQLREGLINRSMESSNDELDGQQLLQMLSSHPEAQAQLAQAFSGNLPPEQLQSFLMSLLQADGGSAVLFPDDEDEDGEGDDMHDDQADYDGSPW